MSTELSGELFASAADYYARYRSGYPDGPVGELAGRLGLDGSQVAVDVGCGTGQVAIPLAAPTSRSCASHRSRRSSGGAGRGSGR